MFSPPPGGDEVEAEGVDDRGGHAAGEEHFTALPLGVGLETDAQLEVVSG
jgi:hypothetical protein